MNIAFFISLTGLVFCFFIFFYFKWYIKRRTSAEELLAEYRSEVYRLIAEIDSATDRDSLLVEDRIKKLKAILEDTDKRISVYVRELDRSRSGEALYRSLGQGIRAALKTEQPPQAAPAQTAGEKQSEVMPPPAQPDLRTGEPAAETSRQQIRSQIEALARKGISPQKIASRLNISLSEVDLALNLLGIHT